MRWYKIVACISLILSVFCFVHAAPVAVQEVREASADAVDGNDNVIIGSGKRAEDPLSEEEPLIQSWEQQQASASEYWQSTPWRGQRLSSAPNYASGTGPKPSSSSDSGDKLIQPGTSNEIQPASSSEAKSASFVPSKVLLPSEGVAKLIQPGISTEIKPASSSMAKSVSFSTSTDVILPSGESESPPRAKMAAQPTKPKFKNIIGKLLRKLKFSPRISGAVGGDVIEG